MLRLALILSALSAPASAQTAGQCIGLMDGLAWLESNGYAIEAGGRVQEGRIAIYTHPDGQFLVVVFDAAEACIAASGVEWAAVDANA